MIWLYWRRSRFAIAIAGAALGALAGLVLVADALAGPEAESAAMHASGGVQPRSTVPATSSARARRGMLLMSSAVAACQSVSYRGVQIVAWSSPNGSSSYLIDVWHRSGRPELAATDGDADDRSAGQVPTAVGGPGAVGVLSISPAMLTLMRTNYVVEYAGSGTTSDRSAEIVAVRRRDGTLAAQFWLDSDTGLPLRREMFDESGRRVSEGAFIDLRLGLTDVGAMPPVAGQPWELVPPFGSRSSSRPTSGRLTALREEGWPVPRALGGNMVLASVARNATRSGPVLDASYSDGLSVVSVFIQRGELSGDLPGWHRTAVRGLPVYSTESGELNEHGVAWSADGFVYTVIADAPPEAVAQVIAQLPHERDLGFWQRVRRGIGRIGSWFDPFG